MKRTDFSYELPESLIAQTPSTERDGSRLLVLNRNSGAIEHTNFRVLTTFLRKGDLLVRNNSKVIKARIFGYKEETGGRVEILLNKHIKSSTDSTIWECISKPGLRVGQKVTFGNGELSAECIMSTKDDYTRQLEFRVSRSDFFTLLEQIGETPLPPYIAKDATKDFSSRYQTTYAATAGSVAAPTAGLHFTPAVDEALRDNGVEIAEVTLHVGLGTFLPVKSDDISAHTMHAEQFTLSPETAEKINQAKAAGRRVIAVGTTTCRVLESCAVEKNNHSEVVAQSGETAIFIYPPHQFRILDGLITNFHLPESTLLMLISAFVSAPNTQHEFTTFLESSVGKAYQEAIKENYRFFSFGDSMFIH